MPRGGKRPGAGRPPGSYSKGRLWFRLDAMHRDMVMKIAEKTGNPPDSVVRWAVGNLWRSEQERWKQEQEANHI